MFSNSLFHEFGNLQGFGLLYKGYFRKNKFHSFGKLDYANNSSFEGVFDKNQFVHGTLRWSDGKAYSGEFIEGEFEGKGKLITNNGEISEGMWLKGKLTGECTVNTIGGCILKGIFTNGLLNSIGKLKSKEFRYRGEFTNSRPNGKGIFQFISGIKYEGDVKDGKIDGFGLMTYPSGEIYEGLFVNSEQRLHILMEKFTKGKFILANLLALEFLYFLKRAFLKNMRVRLKKEKLKEMGKHDLKMEATIKANELMEELKELAFEKKIMLFMMEKFIINYFMGMESWLLINAIMKEFGKMVSQMGKEMLKIIRTIFFLEYLKMEFRYWSIKSIKFSCKHYAVLNYNEFIVFLILINEIIIYYTSFIIFTINE